jgi:outer membrane receptor protein involved in Fe transport
LLSRTIFIGLLGLSSASAAWAEEPILITATRAPEPELTTPTADTLISGDEARSRGAIDLRSALAPAAGVEVLPGSDTGPASSVVAMQGLTEMDAYLLVVDGVPYGGSFNPNTAALDLIDFDRIEVVRGAAPVTFGATSFVGVIDVIHADPGRQQTRGLVQAGTLDTGRAAFATRLSDGSLGQSLLASFEHRGFSQDRSHFTRGHVLYRAATDVGAGRLHLDIDGTILRQAPFSPHPVDEKGLNPAFPRDANANPRDAAADQDRLQANLGYDTKIGGATWSTIVSGAETKARNIRGFLREDFDLTPPGESNADGFRQHVRTTDVYFDTHVAGKGSLFDWVVGADWLYGNGRQRSANFEYYVDPDGSNAPRSTTLHIDESTMLKDRRSFGGLYAQAVVRPTSALTLLAGIRLNRTVEHRCGGEAEDSGTPEPDECQARHNTRLAGSAGASYILWKTGANALVAFADYRNTYKPAAIDFGPEAEPDILKPETASSWEAGLKANAAGGRFHGELSYFDMRFRNLVIPEDIDGLPALANGGKQRFRGVEAEAQWAATDAFTVSASYAHHIARFTDYELLTDDGTLVQLAGNRLELSPKDVGTAILTYAPRAGPQASATLRYVGSRFLDKENTIKAGAYATLDARIGWKFGKGWGVFVEGENLTNRRDPVTESELGEGQFYRLSGRRILATLSYGY